MRAEMLLEREPFARRVTDAELELRRRFEAAVGEIAARLGAEAGGQRRLEKFRGKFDDVVQRFAAVLLFLGLRA